MSRLPRVSHLQFLVLGLVRAGSRSGREVRAGLARYGSRLRGPGFYQLMTRLEDPGLVAGTYHQQVVEGQIIRERYYRITALGERAWTECADFYRGAIRDLGRGPRTAHA